MQYHMCMYIHTAYVGVYIELQTRMCVCLHVHILTQKTEALKTCVYIFINLGEAHVCFIIFVITAIFVCR